MSETFLQTFLAQQRQAGDFDSTGQFTVALAKAARKLAQYALPRQHAWVPKLAQAAVGWRAKDLSLVQSRDVSRLTLRPSLRYGLPQAADIMRAFLSGDIGGNDPLSRFCLAIKSLGEQGALPFLLVIDYGSGPPTVFNSGFLPAAQSEKPLSSVFVHPQGISLCVSHVKPEENRLRLLVTPARLVQRARSIMEEFFELAPYCPLNLLFDSRPINDWQPHRKSSIRHLGTLIFSRKLCVARHQRRPWIVPSDFRQGYWGEKDIALQDLRPDPKDPSEEHEADGLIRLHLGGAQDSLLFWVADGVVVARELLVSATKLHCDVLVDASDLPLDLTGLRAVDSVERSRRSALARMSAGKAISGLESRLSGHLRQSLESFRQALSGSL